MSNFRVRRGSILHVCVDCSKKTFFSKRELDRAAKIRCSACGSGRLEVSCEGAGKLSASTAAKTEIKESIKNRVG